MALMVNAPPSSFSRLPPDPPPYEYPPLEALSPVAPPEPPDPPDVFPLVPSSDSPFPCGRLFPVVCRSSPCQVVEGSILRSCPDLSPHPPVTVFQVHHSFPLSACLYSVELVGTRVVWGTLNLGSMVLVVNVPMDRVSVGSIFVALERFLPAVCRSFIVFSLVFGAVILCFSSLWQLEEKPNDICYLLNMILTGIVLPVVSCLELCLFPIFPLVWSELEAQELLVLKGFSSQLMLSSAVDAVENEGGSKLAYVTFKDLQGAETAVLLTGATIVDSSVTVSMSPDYQLPPDALASIESSKESDKSSSPPKEDVSVFRKAEDVVRNMISKGFILGKDAIAKAKSLDEKHQLTSTASAKVTSFDKKIGFTEKINTGTTVVSGKVKEVDQKFQVTEKTKSAIAAAEQTVSNAGSTIMKNRYVLTGTTWVAGAFEKVSRAAEEVGQKAKEKAGMAHEEEEKKKEVDEVASDHLSELPKALDQSEQDSKLSESPKALDQPEQDSKLSESQPQPQKQEESTPSVASGQP